MKSDENSKSVNDVEEHMMKELKNKKETTNVWFKQSERLKMIRKLIVIVIKIIIVKLKEIGIEMERKVIVVLNKLIEVMKVANS